MSTTEAQTMNFSWNYFRVNRKTFCLVFFCHEEEKRNWKNKNRWECFHTCWHRMTDEHWMATVLTSIGVARFVSPIFWYRSFSVSALSPCHGNEPRRKYMNMWPSASKSSRRDCSLPMWVFIDMYLAVPVNDLCSRYGICLLVSKSMYSLARPKSVGWKSVNVEFIGRVNDTHLLYVLFYHVYLNFYRLENFLALHLYKLNVDYARTRSYEAVGQRRKKKQEEKIPLNKFLWTKFLQALKIWILNSVIKLFNGKAFKAHNHMRHNLI